MIDVLIIGNGGAGLCAALSAKEKNIKVLVISKTYPTHSQTCQAQGGINGVINKKAPQGEYISKWEDFIWIQETRVAMKLMANEGFNLAGVYDVFGYRYESFKPDIRKALRDTKRSPTVLLAHQPKFIKEVPSSVDLMLSGHTHGGQIIPFNYLVKLTQPYVKGLHQHNVNTQIYINKGTGFWGPPMRLGASSEITLISIIPN